MRIHNTLRDDDGVKWEFTYDEQTPYEEQDGIMVPQATVVESLRYRKVGEDEGEWLTLPPWADIHDDWKITLCMFDEDEETGEIARFWELV